MTRCSDGIGQPPAGFEEYRSIFARIHLVWVPLWNGGQAMRTGQWTLKASANTPAAARLNFRSISLGQFSWKGAFARVVSAAHGDLIHFATIVAVFKFSEV
jgi:hypothetical protein